jgi:hypothetical protein
MWERCQLFPLTIPTWLLLRAGHGLGQKSPHSIADSSVDFPFREWERISTAIHIDQPVRKYLFVTILFINRLYELSTTYPFFAFSEHAKIINFRAHAKSVKPSSTRKSPQPAQSKPHPFVR